MKFTGRLTFLLLLPLIRPTIRRTQRAYVILHCEPEILVVKNWLGRQRWSFPGGGIKKGEAPERTIAREVHEELGIDINPAELKLVSTGKWQTDNLGHQYHIFYLKLPQRIDLKTRWPEVVQVDWKKPTELNLSNSSQEVLTALRQANLL